MKNTTIRQSFVTPVALFLLLLTVTTAFAQVTAFTHQGRLTDNGAAANGAYDLQFALFDALNGGAQQGATITRDDVPVTNGVFSVALDFGATPFNGAARWLQISVRAGASTGAYTTLTPRQPLSATPYAIRSTAADNAAQLGGVAASQYVQTNDTRLADARTPTAGSANYIQNQNATPQAANFNISGNGTLGGPLTALNVFTNDLTANATIRANAIVTGGLRATGEIDAAGGLRVSGNFVAGGGIRLNGGVTTSGGLSVGDNVVLNDARILLRDANDPHHAIAYDRSFDGIRFDAFNEFQWVRSSNNSELMHLYGNGVLRAGGFNGRCVTLFAGNGVCNQDLAETFRTKEQTTPGDVVTLIPQDHARPTVRPSLRAYDEHLIGVVSTSPGLVFDEGETHLAGASDQYITKDKTVVAAVGRVPVKFTLENGAINVGDALTSSATEPGKAMKATGAGKIIGLALESSAKAKDGKLLMWLQVGYHAPTAPALTATQRRKAAARGLGNIQQRNAENAALHARQNAQQQQLAELKAQLAGVLARLPKAEPTAEPAAKKDAGQHTSSNH